MSQEQASATFIDREFGHDRIAKLLGRGGMGEVYLAEDTRLRRKVALKFLAAALGDDRVLPPQFDLCEGRHLMTKLMARAQSRAFRERGVIAAGVTHTS